MIADTHTHTHTHTMIVLGLSHTSVKFKLSFLFYRSQGRGMSSRCFHMLAWVTKNNVCLHLEGSSLALWMNFLFMWGHSGTKQFLIHTKHVR